MDEQFRLASISRVDRLEDLVESLRGPLNAALYADEEAELDRCAAQAITGLVDLERAARVLLNETVREYQIRSQLHG